MSGPTNQGTLEFYKHVEQRCMEIAVMPPSQHEVEIAALANQYRIGPKLQPVLTPRTLMAVVEKYAYRRIPDYPVLATRLIEQLGRSQALTMLASNHGMRDLKQVVQTALNDEGLSVTGPRVAAILTAINAGLEGASPLYDPSIHGFDE